MVANLQVKRDASCRSLSESEDARELASRDLHTTYTHTTAVIQKIYWSKILHIILIYLSGVVGVCE